MMCGPAASSVWFIVLLQPIAGFHHLCQMSQAAHDNIDLL